MKLQINWSDPVIPQSEVLNMKPSDLDTFYITATDLDKSNLFFVLLTSAHHYEAEGNPVLAAHLYFLTANYLFISLTPPRFL